jgi:hypothetical protein
MQEIFTPETLLQYLYNETNEAQNRQIRLILKTDKKLYSIYQELKISIGILDLGKAELQEKIDITEKVFS